MGKYGSSSCSASNAWFPAQLPKQPDLRDSPIRRTVSSETLSAAAVSLTSKSRRRNAAPRPGFFERQTPPAGRGLVSARRSTWGAGKRPPGHPAGPAEGRRLLGDFRPRAASTEPSHQLSAHGEEMSPVVPGDPPRINQPEVPRSPEQACSVASGCSCAMLFAKEVKLLVTSGISLSRAFCPQPSA